LVHNKAGQGSVANAKEIFGILLAYVRNSCYIYNFVTAARNMSHGKQIKIRHEIHEFHVVKGLRYDERVFLFCTRHVRTFANSIHLIYT